jgi:hypothetical protein
MRAKNFAFQGLFVDSDGLTPEGQKIIKRAIKKDIR